MFRFGEYHNMAKHQEHIFNWSSHALKTILLRFMICPFYNEYFNVKNLSLILDYEIE